MFAALTRFDRRDGGRVECWGLSNVSIDADGIGEREGGTG